MFIRPMTCGMIAVAMTSGAVQTVADERPETLIEHASGLEFESPIAERLKIRRVAPHTPAAAAGLCAGDIVLGIDRFHFITAAEAEAYLDCQCSNPVRFTVLRDGAEHKLIFVGLQPAYGQQSGIGIRIAGSEPVVIVAVYGGSPADKAGILPGDELLAVNDVASSDASAVTAAMSHYPVGEPVRLTIRRDGVDQTVAVEPEEWMIVFDQPVHVLPGWEGRYRYLGCHVHRDQFATRTALAVELASLREEIRKLRNELNEMNARRVARPGALTEE